MISLSRRYVLLAGLAIATLSGCGFHLRGAQPLPFQTIYLGLSEYSDLAAALRRQIEVSGTTKVVASAAEAQVQLQVIKNSRAREITSLNSAGKVREYELRRYFDFRVTAPNGGEWLPVSKILIKRTLTFNDKEQLAKDSEEALLYKDMDADLVRQVIRRLEAAHPEES